jgi:hypothetical protein
VRIPTCILTAGTLLTTMTACGPVAQRCTSNDDCARAVCVDGACVDGFIGETTEARRDLDLDLDLNLDLLSARPLFTDVSEEPPPPPVNPGPPPTNPPLNDEDDEELPSSCLDYLEEHDTAISGFYRVRGRFDDAVVVECDMDSDGGGWTIVADIVRDGCPAGWVETLSGHCDRPAFEQVASASFPLVVDYTDVRGSARGWSSGDNRAFDVSDVYFDGGQANSSYLDGLSLTVNDDGARRHLWSFAAGGVDPYESTACPAEGGVTAPGDVDGAYSCDTRRTLSLALWDGDLDADGGEDVGDFSRLGAPQGDTLEARIISPLEGFQSVWITSLRIAVR